MNSTRQRGGRRKFGDHGSGRNDDGNGLAVAVTAKDDDGSGATRRGVDSTGFLLLANQKKDLTGDYFNWESLLQFSDTGNTILHTALPFCLIRDARSVKLIRTPLQCCRYATRLSCSHL